ncbi:translation initiation factor aIF-1A [Ignisphaera sp. 4213-co]|uniref:Translation initiation factor 1A n=1 Tax=Ignisphaera cupida TaxID=3050454 RepID=A0ABD4Z5R3_9CREN|nr:translation initiation factor aIF-1A [Ignisphaera sp. 4213-co]MDK6028347.1 translation initiation factor aIF-1A [Ignisphaera sp. 4213-co]
MAKDKKVESTPRDLTLPTQGQILCVVEEIIGADFLKVRCVDGVPRVCRIPGKYRRRVWFSGGDVVLVQPWDFQQNKGDIIYKYSKDEVRRLISMGLLSKEFVEGAV